jgi:hypothetical protein
MDPGEFFKSELQQHHACTAARNNAHDKIQDFCEFNTSEAVLTENERWASLTTLPCL